MKDKYSQTWVLWFCSDRRFTTWAITLGQSTYYSVLEKEVGARWRRHEEKHKEQWRTEGRIRFAAKYLWFSIRYGYENNPLEVEARAAER